MSLTPGQWNRCRRFEHQKGWPARSARDLKLGAGFPAISVWLTAGPSGATTNGQECRWRDSGVSGGGVFPGFEGKGAKSARVRVVSATHEWTVGSWKSSLEVDGRYLIGCTLVPPYLQAGLRVGNSGGNTKTTKTTKKEIGQTTVKETGRGCG